MEKPRVTEIRVRMDCNGCVHKIKKALHGITGIYDIYIDFPQQKITIIGWADPEKIVKAIKKTRKSATICLHTEQSDQPAQETEPEPEDGAPEGGSPPPESTNPMTEQPQTEAAPPEEPSQPDNPPLPEEKPSPESPNEREKSQSTQPSNPKEPEEIHVIHHHPPNYGYQYAYARYNQEESSGRSAYPIPIGPGLRGEPPHQYAYGHYNQEGSSGQSAYPIPRGPGFRGEPPHQYAYGHYNHEGSSGQSAYPIPSGPGFRGEPPQQYAYGHYNQEGSSGLSAYPIPSGPGFRGEPPRPVYVSHSYNTYKPSPYVTEYAYPQSPPTYPHYSRPDHYSQVYYSGNSSNGSVNGNGNITSMFSEENPNACSIV